ncbi:MAG: spermidine synthase, partial [Atopobiaceae bacterium]|nr:spermidine synthase [Atopobiaceae bacterium]
RYARIVSDAFGGKRPLGPMQGCEGAPMGRERLAPEGVFLANVRSPLEGDGAAGLLEAKVAFGMVFEHVTVIPERPEEPGRLQNNVLVACD